MWFVRKRRVRRIRRKRKPSKLSRAKYIEHHGAALELVKNRIEYFNNFYGFKINRVAIRNQLTRWGSCSLKGNLNFNYRIALLEPQLADYIIVHELCHLKEFNHSKNFWDLVAQTIPDHASRRRKLNSLTKNEQTKNNLF